MRSSALRLTAVALRRKVTGAALLICAALLFVNTSHATPIEYSLTLTLNGIFYPNGCRTTAMHSFGCDLTPVGLFVATFFVDDALLSQTGKNLPGVITDFYLQIGTVVWDQAHRSDFAGFRGPYPGCPTDCIGASSPGFDVFGGRITGLEGDVFGPGDIPFIDFYPGNAFIAYDSIADLFMSGELSPVPEPSSVLLMAMGLFGWWVLRIIRPAQAESHSRKTTCYKNGTKVLLSASRASCKKETATVASSPAGLSGPSFVREVGTTQAKTVQAGEACS